MHYDAVTKQYYIYNDQTIGIYGLWETKKDAVQQYVSAFHESLLLDSNNYINHEAVYA
jgi:hypothetical protein